MPSKKYLRIEEVIAILEDEDENEEIAAVASSSNVNVVYIPPDADEISDEEQIDDNVMNDNGAIDVDIAGTVELEYESEDESENDKIAEPTTKRYKSINEFNVPKWTRRISSFDKTPVDVEEERVRNVVEKLSGKSPIELFNLFFDDEMLHLIIEQTNIYASQCNVPFIVESHDIKRFIGFLFFTGYHKLPEWKLYWSNDPSFGVEIIRNAFPRNRAEMIKRFIHLADNTKIDPTDKFAKVRPMVDLCNKRFIQFGVFAHNLSIDEEMIPYFGRHSCKMFIKGKPIRFGFKAWCLTSSNGYLYNIKLYGGSSSNYDKSIGLGADTVLSLLRVVESPSSHTIYFDNFFTSYHLMCLLSTENFFATGNLLLLLYIKLLYLNFYILTGTVRCNRIGKAQLPEKMTKGESAALFDMTNEVLAIRWRDNALVTVLTNHGALDPKSNTKRYDRVTKTHINVKVPGAIGQYNKYMGGVDLHDNALANYRIAVRSKKWWWPLFINLLGNMMVNAWKLHVLVSTIEQIKPLSQLQFRAAVVNELLTFTRSPTSEQPSMSSSNLREKLPNLNTTVHCILRCSGNPRRCVICHTHTPFECQVCKVRLHQKCFSLYSKHLD